MEVLTGPNIKDHLAWTKYAHGLFDRTKFQEHFGVDQMSQWTFGQDHMSINQQIMSMLCKDFMIFMV